MGLIKLFIGNLSRCERKVLFSRHFCNTKIRKPPWKVLFFGTDDFSIFSLDSLTQEYRNGNLISNLEVVTTIRHKPNPVKLFSEKNNLHLHKWPPNINKNEFDVGLVVSFGHLIPKHIIDCFPYGMLNVHASLLPRWRGAAPIIYAIANGDTQTGVTIMKINPEKFDIGEIVLQESVAITPDTKMSELRTILGKLGATSLVKTLKSLQSLLDNAKSQPSEGITYAPKVNVNLSCINWTKMTSTQVYNLSRALEDIFPLQTTWKGITIKLSNIKKSEEIISDSRELKPGYIYYDKEKRILKVLCCDNKFITVERVGVAGKKTMSSKDFNNGYVKKEPQDCRFFE